jgi:hypothetical protein
LKHWQHSFSLLAQKKAPWVKKSTTPFCAEKPPVKARPEEGSKIRQVFWLPVRRTAPRLLSPGDPGEMAGSEKFRALRAFCRLQRRLRDGLSPYFPIKFSLNAFIFFITTGRFWQEGP